jgi:3-hydroxyisobutyrate dehydrogenase-like beta-hydroxyacid dehydrogenase
MATYGFLGLGIMGTEMAGNLLKAGNTVHVWNRTPARCDTLEKLGALPERSPAAVMSACDITFAMVSDPAASKDLCFGEQGVLSAMKTGKAYIDVSTIDPETSSEICESVEVRGGRYLEAPVSGSKKPAADGTLVFLCAGDKSLYDEARPALEVMGKRSFYFGEVGRGAQAKLLNNMIMGVMMTALAEGLALAAEVGLDPARLLEVLAEGAVANPMFALKGPLMSAGSFSPAFPLKHMHKDMRLALEMGTGHLRALPVSAAACGTFARALDAGDGDKDFCAVINAVKA